MVLLQNSIMRGGVMQGVPVVITLFYFCPCGTPYIGPKKVRTILHHSIHVSLGLIVGLGLIVRLGLCVRLSLTVRLG